jgi:hypothetical protein
MLSNEKTYFETEEKQKQEINKLIQSNQDLMAHYLDLKKRIEYTNLFTEVEIDGKKRPISDLLVIKRKMAQIMLNTFNSLNTVEADSRRRSFTSYSESGKTPQVVRYFKEEDRIEGLKVWQDLYDNISSRLEVVNATTPLMSLPPVDAG